MRIGGPFSFFKRPLDSNTSLNSTKRSLNVCSFSFVAATVALSGNEGGTTPSFTKSCQLIMRSSATPSATMACAWMTFPPCRMAMRDAPQTLMLLPLAVFKRTLSAGCTGILALAAALSDRTVREHPVSRSAQTMCGHPSPSDDTCTSRRGVGKFSLYTVEITVSMAEAETSSSLSESE